MIIINWVRPFSKTYWVPMFQRRSDKKGLWFCEVRFLRMQVSLYSQEMGKALLAKIAKKETNAK